MARQLLTRLVKRTSFALPLPSSRFSTTQVARPVARTGFLHLVLAAVLAGVTLRVAIAAAAALGVTNPLCILAPYVAIEGWELADPKAAEIARIAVAELQRADWDRLDSTVFHDDTTNLALLVDIVRLPPVFATRLGIRGRRKLLRRLTVDSNGMVLYENIPKLVIVDVQNGLGNRLRALGSAMELAFYTRRVLVVLWAADAHINATMADLFDPGLLDKIIVIDEPVPWPIDPSDNYVPLSPARVVPLDSRHAARHSFKYYNLMGKDNGFQAMPKQRIRSIGESHLYIKTAYVLDSPWNNNRLINAFIQSLTPSPPVLKLVCEVEERCSGAQALQGMIGVHIRSRTIVHDNDAVDHECEYSLYGAAITDHWRKMSTPIQFVPEMRRMQRNWAAVVRSSYGLTAVRNTSSSLSYAITQANSDAATDWRVPVDLAVRPKFYVSADSVETIRELKAAFVAGDIQSLPRQCDDRGAECIVYAFADIVALSRTGAMLTSGWSSFSEAAGRLRVRPAGMDPSQSDGYVVRTSGIDFGGKPAWEALRSRWYGFWRAKAGGRCGENIHVDRVSQQERRKLCLERRRNETRRATR